MDLIGRLRELGFARTLILNGADCGIEQQTLIMALWFYEAQLRPDASDAWIHPYYRASHRAYQAAHQFIREAQEAGVAVQLRDDIRFKPLLARLPGFSQGRNTLSYVQGQGSRFYIKAFSVDKPLAPVTSLEPGAHELHCGECTACMQACPTHAIDAEGFHVERCIRFWMMPGKPVPENIRGAMGNRLIGCDECQRCCPHNSQPATATNALIPLERLLSDSKRLAEELRPEIGANLTLPNRLLAQSCMIAGCSGRKGLLPMLENLAEHPSQAVREHAVWAMESIGKSQE